MLRQIFALLMMSSLPASAGLKLELIAGKSLGEVSLGETKTALLAKGFTVDSDRMSEDYTYLVKKPLLVLLKEEKAARICVLEVRKHLSALRFKGKKFPKSAKLEAISKFLGGCGQTQRGSGGLIRSCVDGGVELTTTLPSDDVDTLCVKGEI